MRRRRPWTAAQKTAVLRAFAASGQSATAFCRAHDVPRATLTLWRRGATPVPAPRRQAAETPAFARVALVAAPQPPAPPDGMESATPTSVAGAPTLTLALRAPDGLEAVLSGLDGRTAVAVLRGVFAPRAASARPRRA